MDYPVAFSILVLFALPVSWALERLGEDAVFLKRVFLVAVAVRVLVGTAIYAFQFQETFGGDASTYDYVGSELVNYWREGESMDPYATTRLETRISGWGMYYWVAGIYFLTGRNPLAIQFANCVVSSLIPILVYMISQLVYRHRDVSRRVAVLVGFFPSIVLWGSQGLKDPLILAAICTVLYGTLRLRQAISVSQVAIVLVGLVVLYALRFYVFYIMAAALTFSMLVNSIKSTGGFARQLAGFVIVGAALLYIGVGEGISLHAEALDVDRIHNMRTYMATAAQSGYGADIDVRAEGGMLTAMAVGVVYMMLAPFPWEMSNVRQLITLPEMLLWWGMLPLLGSGVWYSFKYRLIESTAVFTFVLVLLSAYSLYMTNVGTAYRQRAQLLPFFLLFVTVGYTLRAIRKHGRIPPSSSGVGSPG